MASTNINNIEVGRETLSLWKTKYLWGGLPDSLTGTQFEKYFESFGSVKDAIVMHDGEGMPRGFRLVIFNSEDVVHNVLKKRFHELNNKIMEVKRAEPKERMNCGPMDTYDSYSTGLGLGWGWGCYGSWYPWGGFNHYTYYAPPPPLYPYLYDPYVVVSYDYKALPVRSYWDRPVPAQAPHLLYTTGTSSTHLNVTSVGNPTTMVATSRGSSVRNQRNSTTSMVSTVMEFAVIATHSIVDPPDLDQYQEGIDSKPLDSKSSDGNQNQNDLDDKKSSVAASGSCSLINKMMENIPLKLEWMEPILIL